MKSLKRTFCIASFLIFSTFMVQAADIVQDPGIQRTEVNVTSKIVIPEPATHSLNGLIVDARSLGLEATFAPVIYDETGKPVTVLKKLIPA